MPVKKEDSNDSELEKSKKNNPLWVLIQIFLLIIAIISWVIDPSLVSLFRILGVIAAFLAIDIFIIKGSKWIIFYCVVISFGFGILLTLTISDGFSPVEVTRIVEREVTVIAPIEVTRELVVEVTPISTPVPEIIKNLQGKWVQNQTESGEIYHFENEDDLTTYIDNITVFENSEAESCITRKRDRPLGTFQIIGISCISSLIKATDNNTISLNMINPDGQVSVKFFDVEFIDSNQIILSHSSNIFEYNFTRISE